LMKQLYTLFSEPIILLQNWNNSALKQPSFDALIIIVD